MVIKAQVSLIRITSIAAEGIFFLKPLMYSRRCAEKLFQPMQEASRTVFSKAFVSK
jgi:hypothetical protein